MVWNNQDRKEGLMSNGVKTLRAFSSRIHIFSSIPDWTGDWLSLIRKSSLSLIMLLMIKTSIEQWTNWKKSGSLPVLHRLQVFVNQRCSARCNSTTPPAGSVCSSVWKTQRWRWVNRSRSKGQFLLLGISVNIFNPFVFWAVWTGTIVGGGGYWCQMGVTCCSLWDPDLFCFSYLGWRSAL